MHGHTAVARHLRAAGTARSVLATQCVKVPAAHGCVRPMTLCSHAGLARSGCNRVTPGTCARACRSACGTRLMKAHDTVLTRVAGVLRLQALYAQYLRPGVPERLRRSAAAYTVQLAAASGGVDAALAQGLALIGAERSHAVKCAAQMFLSPLPGETEKSGWLHNGLCPTHCHVCSYLANYVDACVLAFSSIIDARVWTCAGVLLGILQSLGAHAC